MNMNLTQNVDIKLLKKEKYRNEKRRERWILKKNILYYNNVLNYKL